MKIKMSSVLLIVCMLISLMGCAGPGGEASPKGEGTLGPEESSGGEEALGSGEAVEAEGNIKSGEAAEAEGNIKSGEAAEAEASPGEGGGSETGSGDGLSMESALEDEIQEYLARLTLEEKAAQLFVILPEALMTGAGTVTAAGDTTKAALDEIPVGGFIYMENNLRSREQVTKMLANVQKYSQERIGLPAFLCVDEEGGTVARINGKGIVDAPVIGNMSDMGREGSRDRAYEIGTEMGTYLSDLGFNVDFAPVADVWSNPENTVVKKRSFGNDPGLVSELALAVSEGLKQQGVLSCYKHFPGHGATAGDTHAGYAYTNKTLEELKECELIPFQEGIREQVPIIMVGHISLPQVIGDDTPASLSHVIITELLREEMGYDGLVVTDALNMGAIVQQYSSAQAAVMTLQAGADLILMPKDFRSAYEGVLQAVEDGKLTEERIDASVERILRMKLGM